MKPPVAGVYEGDKACVFQGVHACASTLDQEKYSLRYSSQAVMKSGCRFTSTVQILSDDETFECVYDDGNWVGVRRVETGSQRDCPGVDVWESGEMYEACDAEEQCLLDPEDRVTKTIPKWCPGQSL